MDKVKNFLSQFFCYEFSAEWVLYLVIILLLISFFIVSCYNANKLITLHDEDIDIRNGVNIAIECVIIFVGFYLFVLWYKQSVTHLQLCFCGHISIFLILTGAAAMATTAKHIEQRNS